LEVEEVSAGGRLLASFVFLSALTGLRAKVISYKDASDGPRKDNVSAFFDVPM